MNKNIIIFCAHPDDEAFGVGGTIAKYSKEGFKVKTVVFSYGEQSHPWIKKKFVIEKRVKESQEAAKILGSEIPIFLSLREGHFLEDVKKRNIENYLAAMIKKVSPTKIFTHSRDDPHPDHNSVYNIVLNSLKKSGKRCSVYTFDVWNPLDSIKRKNPLLYVDISETFKIKIKALKCFKSQTASLISLLWSVYFSAVKNGFESGTKFAEAFYKIK
ncbi:MAG: PIG-L deacetylase family protein [Candidatus Woesearchaeota archaeon]